MSLRNLLLVIVIFGAIPMILMRPHIGVLVWSWIGYMNPHRLAWGFAFNFPFAAIIGAVTLFGLLISNERKKIPMTSVTIVLILFVIWMNVTTLFALDPEEATAHWEKVMKIQLMVFVTLILMWSRERLNALIWVIVISIGFYGVKGGIFTIMTGGQYKVLGPEGSFIAGNTEISLALIMILPLLRYLQQTSNNKWVGYGLLIAMALCALSIVGSYSRGAFLAGGAMGLFLLLKSRKKILIACVMIILIPAILAFMPDKWFSRMHTIETFKEDASAMGRINAWGFALNLAMDRPMTGGGYQTFTPDLFMRYAPEPKNFHDAHSIYFEVLGEHGFVGLILFLLLGALTWRSANWIRSRTKESHDYKWAYDLSSMIQVSLIGYALGGAFLGLAYFDLFYHLIAIVILTRIIVEKSEQVIHDERDDTASVNRPLETGFANGIRKLGERQ